MRKEAFCFENEQNRAIIPVPHAYYRTPLCYNRSMNILVVGSGSCEHAVIEKIRKSDMCDKIYCTPGNAGIARIAECVDIPMKDTDALVRFALEKEISLTFTCSHVPVQNDIASRFESAGLKIFAPSAESVRAAVHSDRMKPLCEEAKVYYDTSLKTYERILFISDGETILPFPEVISYDYMYDNNEGSEGDSMGAVCGPGIGKFSSDRVRKEILSPLVPVMRKNGIVLSGIFGLRVTEVSGRLIFGGFDGHVPGAVFSVILERLENDLLALMLSATDGRLYSQELKCSRDYAVSAVTIFTQRITEPQKLTFEPSPDVRLYHSHTTLTEDGYYAAGKRVLCLCASGRKLDAVRSMIYEQMRHISFRGMYYRSDIARDLTGKNRKKQRSE